MIIAVMGGLLGLGSAWRYRGEVVDHCGTSSGSLSFSRPSPGGFRFRSAGPSPTPSVPGRLIASTPVARPLDVPGLRRLRTSPPHLLRRRPRGDRIDARAGGRRAQDPPRCGLFQGRRRGRGPRYFRSIRVASTRWSSPTPIDHSGNIPSLIAQGFRGPIYATHATRDLCAIMLRDSGRIHERDAGGTTARSAAGGAGAPAALHGRGRDRFPARLRGDRLRRHRSLWGRA